MNQLYPALRDKNDKRRGIALIDIAGEVVSGKACLPGRGALLAVSLETGFTPGEFFRGENAFDLSDTRTPYLILSI